MEEKKVLNEEKVEEVSGGRYLAGKEFARIDLSSKEAFLKSVKKLPPLSGETSKELPRELLDKVSGGSVFGGELDDWDMD